MKIILKYFSLFFISTLFLVLNSCNKDIDNAANNSTDITEEVIVRSSLGLDNPVVSNGVYEFRDYAHYIKYLSDLQGVYNQDYDQFKFDVSQDFQNQAARDPSVKTVFQRVSNDDFVNPSLRFMSDISDPIIQSIVNLNYEVKVGDALLTYMNDKQIFMSSSSDLTKRNEIRSLRNGQLISLNQIPSDVTWAQDDDIQSLLFGSCKCSINIQKTSCNTVRVFGSCKDLVWGDGNGTVDIKYFVNGSTNPTTSSTPVNGNFEFFFDISMFNAIVNFEASADPNCVFGKTETVNFGAVPNQAVCDFEERATSWLWKEDGGSQAISYQTRYHKNFFAGYEQAHIYSYHFNGTSWVNNKSKLRVSIDATRKTLNCIVDNTENETKSCNNCKDKRASVNSLFFFHCDGDVNGTFRKELNWSGMAWSIDATQTVDFNCCP